MHGRLLQTRLLLERNPASATAAERDDLINQTAAALAARRQLMRADGRIPAAIATEVLRTAAALVDIILKPSPPYATPMSATEGEEVMEAWAEQEPVPGRRQLPGEPAAGSPAVAAFAAAVLECCRAAVVGGGPSVVAGGSPPGGAGTDAADPMRSLFLKEAALLFFCGSLHGLLKQQHAAETPSDGGLPDLLDSCPCMIPGLQIYGAAEVL